MDVGKLGMAPRLDMAPASRTVGPQTPVPPPADSRSADQISTAVVGSAKATASLLDQPATPPDPVAAARKRLETIVLPKAERSSHYGQIERTSLRPNESAFTSVGNVEPLRQAVADNADPVATAKGQLDPKQLATYDQLWQLAAGDLGAQASLQLLVMEGTLTARGPGAQTATLLDELGKLADEGHCLAPGLERTALVCDLMQEIAFPSSISQRDKGTCTVTSVQILLAKTRPAEYARIVSGLAGEANEPVTLAGGGKWQREPGTETADESNRTASSRLFQAAAMEAQLPEADYDNALDKHRLEDGALQHGGETGPLSDLVKDLLGPGAYVAPQWHNWFEKPDGLANVIIEAAAQGHPSLVTLFRHTSVEASQGGAGHEILVIGATDTGVRFINPWGQTETTTKEALARMVRGAVFVNLDSTEAPAASLPRLRQP